MFKQPVLFFYKKKSDKDLKKNKSGVFLMDQMRVQ